jgi:hypothetical protein
MSFTGSPFRLGLRGICCLSNALTALVARRMLEEGKNLCQHGHRPLLNFCKVCHVHDETQVTGQRPIYSTL